MRASNASASARGLELVGVVEELDRSGGDNALWNACIEGLERGEARALVVWNLSRFARASRAAVTCLIADDHPAVLDSVSRFLELQAFTVVSRVARGDEARTGHHLSVAGKYLLAAPSSSGLIAAKFLHCEGCTFGISRVPNAADLPRISQRATVPRADQDR